MDEDASSSEPNTPILRDELMMTENGRKNLKIYPILLRHLPEHPLSTT